METVVEEIDNETGETTVIEEETSTGTTDPVDPDPVDPPAPVI